MITGSYNWTASAGAIHDENTLLIYDAEMANVYQQEFWARFGLGVAAEEQFIENQLKIFPNPTANTFEVDFPTEGQLTIFDIQGRNVFQKEVNSGNQQVDISTLPQGNYVLLIKNKKRQLRRTSCSCKVEFNNNEQNPILEIIYARCLE